MISDEDGQEHVEHLLDTPELATALESEQFKKFLDQVPIAIAVSDLRDGETVVYANPEFEKLSGLSAARLDQENWEGLSGSAVKAPFDRRIDEAIVTDTDFVGTFRLERKDTVSAIVDVYSNVIEDDDGKLCFRLVALVDVSAHDDAEKLSIEERIREKDTLLRELQHRVKNNLQMMRSLTENAKAQFDVTSTVGEGTKVTIIFKRSAAVAG